MFLDLMLIRTHRQLIKEPFINIKITFQSTIGIIEFEQKINILT